MTDAQLDELLWWLITFGGMYFGWESWRLLMQSAARSLLSW